MPRNLAIVSLDVSLLLVEHYVEKVGIELEYNWNILLQWLQSTPGPSLDVDRYD